MPFPFGPADPPPTGPDVSRAEAAIELLVVVVIPMVVLVVAMVFRRFV